MPQSETVFSFIPTECPKFLAACATVGIELQAGGAAISNVYSAGRKYDPEEPGDVSFCVSDGQGINPLAIAKVWLHPDSELAEAEALGMRLRACKDPDEWERIAGDIDNLHVTAAIATISHFKSGRFAIDSRAVSDQERQAANVMSGLASAMRADKRRDGARFSLLLAANWTPSMFAWVKAWVSNYLELREIWKAATPSIKIDRGDDFPLVIPKGKDFYKLMKRWA